MTDAEKTLRAFYRSCHEAGRNHCSLGRKDDKSWKDIKGRVEEFLENVYREPLVAWDAKRPGLVTSGYIRRERQLVSLVSTYLIAHHTTLVRRRIPVPSASIPIRVEQLCLGPVRSNVSLELDRPSRLSAGPDVGPESHQTRSDGTERPEPIGSELCGFSEVSKGGKATHSRGDGCEPGESKERGLADLRCHVSPGGRLELFAGTDRWKGIPRCSVAMMEQHGGCQFWPKSEKPVERFEVSRPGSCGCWRMLRADHPCSTS